MKRRPLFLLCIAASVLIGACRLVMVSVIPAPVDLAEAERILNAASSAVICGIVSERDVREESVTYILKKAVLEHEGRRYAVGRVQLAAGAPYGTEGAAQEPLYRCGWTLRAQGEAAVIEGPGNPGEFDYRRYEAVRGIRIRIGKADIRVLGQKTAVFGETLIQMRERAGRIIRSLFPEDVAGVVEAMLIGDRTDLDPSVRNRWQRSGIMHVLAISGLHLGLIGMALFSLLKWLRLGPVCAGTASVLFMAVYTVFIGCPVSAIRALIMFVLMILAKLLGRTYDPPTALSAAALLILMENPEYLFDSAFRMSCCAVLITFLFRERGKGTAGILLYLYMLPLVAEAYYEVPLLSVPANLLIVPVVPVLIGSGIISGAFSAASLLLISSGAGAAGNAAARLSAVLSLPATWLLRTVNMVTEWISQLPFATIITGHPGVIRILLFYSAAAVWTALLLKWRLYRRRFFLYAALPVFILILSFRPRRGMKTTFLDVGQGDGICLEMPSGAAMLVDAGSSGVRNVGERRLIPYLKYEGIRCLDYVVVTHPDEDHISGIRELLTLKGEKQLSMKIGTLLLPAPGKDDGDCRMLAALAGRSGARVFYVKRGDALRIGDCGIDVLGPGETCGASGGDRNEMSIVLRVRYRSFDMLLTGDVTGDAEEEVLLSLKKDPAAQPPGRTAGNVQAQGRFLCGPAFEVLKPAHHGSRYSTPPELLSLIHPAVSVISCGRNNLYGHPHEELLTRLSECGSCVARTDLSGAVTVETDGRSFTVRTFRAGA